jgi:hypothetical protein
MRNVDHQSHLIHLGDDLPAEGRKAVSLPAIPLTGVGIGELAVAVMRKRQVASAAIEEFLHPTDLLADRITVFNANERSFPSLGFDPPDVIGSERQFDFVGCKLFGESMNRFEFFDRHLVSTLATRRLKSVGIARLGCLADVNDEKYRADTAVERLR